MSRTNYVFIISGELTAKRGNQIDVWLALRKMGADVEFDKSQLRFSVSFHGMLPYTEPSDVAHKIAPWVETGSLMIRNYTLDKIERQDFRDGFCYYCPVEDYPYSWGHDVEFVSHLPKSVINTVLEMYGHKTAAI